MRWFNDCFDARQRERHSCHTLSPAHLLVGTLLMTLASGCFNAGIPVRSADLPSAGNFSAHAQWNVATYAPGEVVASDGSRAEQILGERVALADPLMFLILPASWVALNGTLGFEVGLAEWLSLDISLGLQQVGGDLRFGLLDQHDGAPVSLALSAGAAYRPFIEASTPWLSAGVDLSHRWTSVVATTNLYASYGPESHVLSLSRAQYDQFPDDGDDEGAGPHYALTRDELRLHLALGLGPALVDSQGDVLSTYRSPASEGEVSIALVGYWTALTEEPDFMACYSCQTLEPFSMEEDLGVSLVVSARFRGLD